MADAILGVVTGGLAVASLAIQLVEVAQKLHAFWDAFEAADSNIERIKDHLLLIQIISASIIDTCNQEPGICCEEAVTRSIATCKSRTEKLESHLQKHVQHQSGSATKRSWTTLKWAVKDKTIQKVESQLRGDVMMLLLTLQPFFHHVQIQKVASLSGKVSALMSQYDSEDIPSTGGVLKPPAVSCSSKSDTLEPGSRRSQRDGRLELSQLYKHRISMAIDSFAIIDRLSTALSLSMPPAWMRVFRSYLFGVMYTSVTFENYKVSLRPEDVLYSNIKRRLKIILPMASYQIQTSSVPWSLTSYPIAQCQSEIFTLCADGDIDTVKKWFKDSSVSPFVVNQHGENLLHAAARYAHADICNLLLDIGVDGSAYDDRLLTPLDHLARRVCTTIAYPSKVVNTIRALVERGRCQPLLPVTSNAVAFYRGPEEGFAWLFASEYAGSNLSEYDSEGWTLLHDAAFNFGWWLQPCVEDPAISWQSQYLLRAGADPHMKTSEGDMTSLDTSLRGGTAHSIDNARKWLQGLKETGINLQKYADEEQRLHLPEHFLKATWDEELWKWIPTKRRVVYKYGATSEDLEIWLDDYDALCWFHCGRFDWDIFQVCSAFESTLRWTELDSPDFITVQAESLPAPEDNGENSHQRAMTRIVHRHLFQFLLFSLILNSLFLMNLLRFH
ncbi:hypothetical protein LSUE1_G009734 [Lachnellula suecica]|uniref:Fungal N-terminal domain-containing protein n=1 Tax=Lachnellula suecica TaxID=602035 RepID=A0A8T9BY58_9HELO|nr:hypothetical protein LSUE1_G009734 [Lachnellula suecica]